MLLNIPEVQNKKDGFPSILQFGHDTDPSLFIEWYKENLGEVEEILLKRGAILIKGVTIDTVDKFDKVVSSTPNKLLDYVDGNSPRTKLSSKVYTSTEYDPQHFITLHNELSYSAVWPSTLFFCCIVPPASGGQTPIADCREILKKMNPNLVAEIEKKKIKYIRNLNGGSGLGPSWQATFETDSKKVVEEFCKQNNIEFKWKMDGGIKLIHHRDGVIQHPKTGAKVWFNQIDQFHPSHLNKEIYETLMLIHSNEDELPTYVTFGDGTKISEDVVKEIRRVVDSEAILNDWEKGNLLIVDNVLTCHGRTPYSGDRKILVSMC